MLKSYLEFECMVECPYRSSCCRVPTEVIRHEGREGIDLLIFGMGAGKDEEKQKRCFVGRAGKYMRKIIKSLWDDPAVGPFNIALSNNVRFHPMDIDGKDREPTETEIARCLVHLKRDIISLNPSVIIPVGKNATSTFLTTTTSAMGSMTSIRGNPLEIVIDGVNRRLIPTWHPSFLCRSYGNFDPLANNKFDKEFISDLLKALGYL